MPAALPFIGVGLSAYSAIKGAQQQGKANKIADQQLAQQNQIRQQVLGRLQGMQGAVGNPFSASYGAIQPAPPAPQGQSLASQMPGGVMPSPGLIPAIQRSRLLR
jgi:hypothetical protein